ncbi:hypothetical protein ONE63_005164 [Megalurothrips usitatus]|uniref:Uncharacterized protein n=1 Tax=Megalurothrips usitatus TaxID=439358 RepID=A0AAV7XZH3_9NEOP|nr:hypothetical protein ONE63_005164 [Megalurothrips usitatus]
MTHDAAQRAAGDDRSPCQEDGLWERRAGDVGRGLAKHAVKEHAGRRGGPLAWRALRVRLNLVLDMARDATAAHGVHMVLNALRLWMGVLLPLSEALILVTERRGGPLTALLMTEALSSWALLWLVLAAHHWPADAVSTGVPLTPNV